MSSCMNNIIQHHACRWTNYASSYRQRKVAATTKKYSFPQGQVYHHCTASQVSSIGYYSLIPRSYIQSWQIQERTTKRRWHLDHRRAQRERIVAEHKRLQTDYKSYITIQKVSKDFIIYAQALKSCTWHTVWSRMRQYLCS